MKKFLSRILPASALCIALGIFLCGCGGTPPIADTDGWSAGNTEISNDVEHIAVDWTDGSVTVGYYDGDAILVEETCGKPLTEETTMHWRLDGDTLRIRYDAPGLDVMNISSLNKQLTILLPESRFLQDLTVDATSGTIILNALLVDRLDLSLTSGDVDAVCSARDISVECTSGNIQLTQKGNADTVSLDSTSGDFTASLGVVETLTADSTSGRITVEAEALEQASAETTSGGVTLKTANCPRAINIDCTSGDVTLALSDKPGFTAEIDTTSGDFDSDIPLSKNGDVYLCGDGSGSVSIDVTSGNVQLLNAA